MNRSTIDKQYSLLKRVHWVWGVFSVGAAGAVTLQKYNYPQLGVGGRTYSAATTGTAPPSGAGPWPLQYQIGTEGIRSVTRTGTGLWTVTMQDNYQRLLSLMVTTSVAGGLANIVQVAENSTISNYASGGGSIIGLALLSASATAADPTSGHTLIIRFELQDATEP